MNYSQLTTAISDYTENYDTTFIANIPVIVKAAEKKIYNAVQLPDVSTTATGSLSSGTSTLAVPAGFLSVLEFAIIDGSSNYVYLVNKEVGFIREAYPVIATTAQPKYYALTNETTFVVGPTPDSSYSYNLRYFAYPESIVTASTTWLGDNFDQLLLYGSLVEAGVFAKYEEDVIKPYVAQYTEWLGILRAYNGSKIPLDAYRGSQYTRVGA